MCQSLIADCMSGPNDVMDHTAVYLRTKNLDPGEFG